VEALAIIQEHTSTQLRVPDLTKLMDSDAWRIMHAAEVLLGEAISVPWEVRTVHLHPSADPPPADPVAMLLFEELSISVNGVRVDLGYQQVHLPAVRIDLTSLANHDDHQDVRIVPVVALRPSSGSRRTIRRAILTAQPLYALRLVARRYLSRSDQQVVRCLGIGKHWQIPG
jgi:hypothetical protein